MAVTNGVVAAPMSTTVAEPVNTTQALEIAGFEQYDYTDYSILDIAENFEQCPILYTITAMGRLKGRNADLNNLGLNEGLTNNFPEHKWDERDGANIDFVANSTINSSATELTLVSTTGLYPHLVMMNIDTNERFRITSVDSATQITIQRAVGETIAQAITTEDRLQVISTASADGVASENSFFVANQTKSNYIQKVVTTVKATDFDRLGYRVGNYEQKIMGEKMDQHLTSLERVALLGEKSSKNDPTTNAKFYTAQGLITHCLNGWTDDISGALTVDTFEASLDNSLRYGSKSKILMGSSKAIRAIRALYDENKIYNDKIEEINLKFTKLTTNFGDFTIMSHPFLNNTAYDNYIFVVDLKFMKVVYPEAKEQGGVMFGMNGKTTFELNKGASSPTYQEGSYYTYLTFELANANAFAAISVL